MVKKPLFLIIFQCSNFFVQIALIVVYDFFLQILNCLHGFSSIFRRHKINKAQKLSVEKKPIKMVVHKIILKYQIQLYPVHKRPVML